MRLILYFYFNSNIDDFCISSYGKNLDTQVLIYHNVLVKLTRVDTLYENNVHYLMNVFIYLNFLF